MKWPIPRMAIADFLLPNVFGSLVAQFFELIMNMFTQQCAAFVEGHQLSIRILQ